MPTGLESALVVLVYVLITLAGTANLYLLFSIFGLITPSKQAVKVEHTGMTQDNSWTKWTAEEQTKTSANNLKATEVALETAKVNQRTEELRLERVRLEKTE